MCRQKKTRLDEVVKWWVHFKIKNSQHVQYGRDTANSFTPTECKKYPSTSILLHENDLAEVNNYASMKN